ESPKRLASTLVDLAARAPGREVVVCRELTKLHEEVWRGNATEAAGHFAAREVRGEVVVVVAGTGDGLGGRLGDEGRAGADTGALPGVRSGPSDPEVACAVEAQLAAGRSVRDSADAVAAQLGVSRRRAYAAAVAARHRSGAGEPGT
ncbi:MAG TPA: hypothetical protein VMD28_10015, partial [Acidimicrobiales bacterium]|nr:hypothetical protein [Acidimicrobiales bacterium]